MHNLKQNQHFQFGSDSTTLKSLINAFCTHRNMHYALMLNAHFSQIALMTYKPEVSSIHYTIQWRMWLFNVFSLSIVTSIPHVFIIFKGQGHQYLTVYTAGCSKYFNAMVDWGRCGGSSKKSLSRGESLLIRQAQFPHLWCVNWAWMC